MSGIRRIQFHPRSKAIRATAPMPSLGSYYASSGLRPWLLRVPLDTAWQEGPFQAALEAWVQLDPRLASHMSPQGKVLQQMESPQVRWQILERRRDPKEAAEVLQAYIWDRSSLWTLWVEKSGGDMHCLWLACDAGLFGAEEVRALGSKLRALILHLPIHIYAPGSLPALHVENASEAFASPLLQLAAEGSGQSLKTLSILAQNAWQQLRRTYKDQNRLHLAGSLLNLTLSKLGFENPIAVLLESQDGLASSWNILLQTTGKDFAGSLADGRILSLDIWLGSGFSASDWAAVSRRRSTEADATLYPSSSCPALQVLVPDDDSALSLILDSARLPWAFADVFPQAFKAVLEHCARGEDSDTLQLGAFTLPLWKRWNQTEKAYNLEQNLFELIEESLQKHQAAVAIDSSSGSMTFAELDRASRSLAAYLNSQGYGPGDLIGLGLPRSPLLIVALLGILRAGAGYVPLDPSFPLERLQYMLDDAKVKACLCQASLTAIVPKASQIISDEELKAILKTTDTQAWKRPKLKRDATAYVIYTSGSTGKPKGVVLGHRSVVNFIISMAEAPGMQAGDRILGVTTLSFDIAVLEVFLPLYVGAQIYLATADEAKDGSKLRQLLEHQKITHFQATPSTYRLMLDAGWNGSSLRKALCGGEAFPSDVSRRLRNLVPEIWNMYGPTETTVWSTIYRLEGHELMLPIGRPIANTAVYILDDDLQPLLPGEKGEIYIAGTGLALGYLGRKDLTDERFLAIPATGTLAYKTGDIGRYRWDGCLEIFGRADSQIKLRGYRMELGEIEAVIGSYSDVMLCIAAVKEFGPDDQRLVAYLSYKGHWNEKEFRQSLKDKLPSYMLPQHYILLRTFPQLPNGKIDRKSLPHPLAASEASSRAMDAGRDQLPAMQIAKRGAPENAVPSPLAKAEDSDSKRQPTPSQSRMLYVESLDPDTTVHNLLAAWMIDGPLDLSCLEKALAAVIAEHESLRMSIADRDGDAHLRLHAPFALKLNLTRAPSLDSIKADLANLSRQKLAIDSVPNFQAGLFQVNAGQQVFFLLTHHIFWDGFSYSVFWKHLQRHYEQAVSTGHSVAQPPAFTYLDYALERNASLDSPALNQQLAYWQKIYTPLPEPLELAYDFPRPQELTHAAGSTWIAWDKDFDSRLTQFARNRGFTLYHVLLATYAVLLHRLSRQEDIVIGSPVAGRSKAEVFDLLGNFINVTTLRIALNGDLRFIDVLQTVKDSISAGMANSDLPFEQLVAGLKLNRDPSRTPLYNCMFFFQDQAMQRIKLGPAQVSSLPLASQTVDTDLVLWIERYAQQTLAGINFRRDLWEESTVAAMAQSFKNLMEVFLDQPDMLLRKAPLLRDSFVDAPLTRPAPPTLTLSKALDLAAQKFPERKAVSTLDGQCLTYGQLRERAGRIARILSEEGVKVGDPVGICMNRTPDMIASLWAILSLGAAYLPLDPQYPTDRLQYMAEDAKTPLIVTEFEFLDRFAESSIPCFCLDQQQKRIAATEVSAIDQANPDDLAYIIYTSGSTGKPKGVEIQHKAAAHFLEAISSQLGFDSSMRTLAVTTISFDISVLEIFATLTQGGQIVLVEHEKITDGPALIDALESFGITTLQATPATWRLLLESSWEGTPGLKGLCGGEALPRDLARKIVPRVAELWNVYGPTEATVWATAERISDPEAPITIGKPLPYYRAYILDGERRPVPQGTIGDLYLGGYALARGYRGREDLTRERFFASPFQKDELMYDTGDLARFRSDGRIEYISRRDNQVKLRGFRIELGEIETAMTEHPAIRQAVCLVREDHPGDKRLVAYAVLNEGQKMDLSRLHLHLRSRLPQYMLPNNFVLMPVFPLTGSGKIDKKALPAPIFEETDAPVVDVPLTASEEKIAQIFRECLGVKTVRPQDNFFELGGHSLLALRVLQRLQTELQVTLKIRDLLLRNVSQLAAQDSSLRQKEGS